MTLLVVFLSLLVGVNVRFSLIPGIVESLLIVGFCWRRFSKKTSGIMLGVILLGLGLSFIQPKFNKKEYRALVVEVKENYFIASSSFEKLYVYEKNNEREIGDIVLLKGEKQGLSFTTLESEFDFKEYLNKKGIYSQISNPKIETIFANPIKLHSLKKKFLSHFDSNTSGILDSILFGGSKSGETYEIFADLHLMRLISNSGIFLYFFYKIILFLLGYIIKDKWSKLIANSVMLFYGLLSFPRLIVIKFVLVLFFKWINEYKLQNKYSYLEIISIIGIGLLIFDHNLGRQDSFILAFIIPILVVLINGSFSKLKSNKKKILVAFIITLFFVPFTASYYNELSPLSVPFQYILMPFMMIFSLMGLLCFLGIPLYSGVNGFSLFLNKACRFLSPIFIKIYTPDFSTFSFLIYELSLIFVIYVFSIKLKDLYKILSLSFSGIFCISLLPINNLLNIEVDFINVGQGDACFISYKTTNILIDTGGNINKDIARSCLIPFFKKKRVYKIDLLITTHNDYDHNGAASSLMTNFKVDNYVTEYQCFPINIGGFSIQNLNTYSDYWDEDNDKSLVLFFTIESVKFLIMGDAPKKIEEQIIESNNSLKCDVIKIGHHGSDTSTSENFIGKIHPNEAVISVGKNNYGHPNKSVLEILKKLKIKIRRTDKEGTISYRF